MAVCLCLSASVSVSVKTVVTWLSLLIQESLHRYLVTWMFVSVCLILLVLKLW